MAEESSIRLKLRGLVQGVGFRPSVFRLAHELHLRGWVLNDSAGAEVALAGREEDIRHFQARLPACLPAAADIREIQAEAIPPDDLPAGFEIRSSAIQAGPRVAGILPDLATCPDCLREMFDPADRRYRYPFANCTHCGPRFSLIERLPYDRVNTTMRRFRMCPACEAEYGDPRDRRFHAQPIACPVCGPSLEYIDASGRSVARKEEALLRTVEALRAGRIVAVKGIGGFHLMVDARHERAVQRLRARKHRDEKPFAVLFPDRAAVEKACVVAPEEADWLESAAAPIVLLHRRDPAAVAEAVAPGLSQLGALLPYSPLHHLLMRELGFPVVATSGNLTDEPICISIEETRDRLGAVAEGFLTHDRPIARPMDDSVMAVCQGRPLMMRRGRGLSPWSVSLAGIPDGWIGAGAQMKSTVAISAGGQAVMSSHIGDLEHDGSTRLWNRTIADLSGLHGLQPVVAATDLHPAYSSTQSAAQWGIPIEAVQHHNAHIAACMAEHGLDGTVLGVAWDGTGYGPDGTIWGGEFLACTRSDFQRVAWLRPFPLMGGDVAAREPRRAALGLLWEMGAPRQPPGFTPEEQAALHRMLAAGLNTVRTSSAGRLFDAVASLLGVCQVMSHEGQAAMRLEALAGDLQAEPYPFTWDHGVLDWAPMIAAMMSARESPAVAAARFHATLVEMIASAALRFKWQDICLSGGCFQNRRLLAGVAQRLGGAGFRVWRHVEVPPNDAGICLGQLAVALARRREGEGESPRT